MTQPTVSKHWREVVVLRIRLQSHQVHLTMLHYYTVHMHAIYSQTQNNTCTKMNLSTVKWAQWNKTQSRELLGLFKCVYSSLCTIVAHNTAQNRPDNFPSCPPDNHHCSNDVYLITRFRESYRSVSMSRKSKRLKKSSSDSLNSGNAQLQHLSEKCYVRVSPFC